MTIISKPIFVYLYVFPNMYLSLHTKCCYSDINIYFSTVISTYIFNKRTVANI